MAPEAVRQVVGGGCQSSWVGGGYCRLAPAGNQQRDALEGKEPQMWP